VRYVLEGSVRIAGNRVRISGQLIDAATGVHRWAERYDRVMEDVFAVQDEVARSIVTILAAHVHKAEMERTAINPPATWQSYDYFMRASHAFAAFWAAPDVRKLYETRVSAYGALGC
jgi:adenylate cyclase